PLGHPPKGDIFIELARGHYQRVATLSPVAACPWPALVKDFTSFMGHIKLHIPGPVEVSERTFRAFCSPMIGHRGQGFKDLYAKMQPRLQRLFYTQQLVYVSTSSAWGV